MAEVTDSLRDQRQQLEADLLQRIRDFEQHTGLRTVRIEVEQHHLWTRMRDPDGTMLTGLKVIVEF